METTVSFKKKRDRSKKAGKKPEGEVNQALSAILRTPLQDEELLGEFLLRGIEQPTEWMAVCLCMVREARKNPAVFKEILRLLEMEEAAARTEKAPIAPPFTVSIRVVD